MKYKLINTLPDLPRDKTLYVDTETTTLYGSLVLLQLYQEGLEHVFIIDVKRSSPETVLDYLKSFNYIVGYNLQYDLEVLGARFEDVKKQYFYDDLYLASKIVYYWLENYGLYDVLNSILKLDIKIDKKAMQKQGFGGLFISQAQLEYAASDVYYLPKLYHAILTQHPNFFKTNRVYRQDLFVSKMMLDIHRVGLKVNKQALFNKKQELTAKLKSFNFPFNPLSPQQVAQVLGTPKADKETLLDLVYQGNELAQQIYEYRKISKLLNFIDKFSVERVFGKFNVVGAKSGRMTCSSENIQQIPRELRSVFGFTEDEGKVYVVADFPQIELRLASLIWQEKSMIDAFVNDIDLHKYTASVIYSKSMTDVSKPERQIAKSANFGLLYGMSGKAFANYVYTNTGIRLSEHEGEAIKRKWLATYPTIAKKHQRVKDVLYAKNVYEDKTILGRPYRTDSFNEALNIQIQGSGAELLKQTIINLKRKTPSLQIANLIHDEIIIECDKVEAEDVADFLQSEMELAWQDICQNAKLDIEKFDLKVEKPDIILSIAKS